MIVRLPSQDAHHATSGSRPSEWRLARDSSSYNTLMRYWQFVLRHCLLCALCDNTACHLYFVLQSWTNYHTPPPRRGRVHEYCRSWPFGALPLPVYFVRITWRVYSSLAYIMCIVHKQTNNYSTASVVVTNICFAHYKEVNAILSITAVTTSSFQFSPLLLMTDNNLLIRFLFKVSQAQ